jgi:hypothetical protein
MAAGGDFLLGLSGRRLTSERGARTMGERELGVVGNHPADLE